MKTLPEKWFTKITEENEEVLYRWLKKQPNVDLDYVFTYYLCSISREDNSYLDFAGDAGNAKNSGCVEISFEEFKWWVLGELPEKWYCQYTSREEFDIANEFFNQYWGLIEATYLAVVEFITWYNEEKLKENGN